LFYLALFSSFAPVPGGMNPMMMMALMNQGGGGGSGGGMDFASLLGGQLSVDVI